MRVVIDTNIIIMALPKASKYRPIFDGLLTEQFELAISESIYQEYIEIVGRKTTQEIAHNFAELLKKLPSVCRFEVFYRWNLIEQDPDDNKFVDCAVSAEAEFIVTNDRHFRILNEIKFPRVATVDADRFLALIKS